MDHLPVRRRPVLPAVTALMVAALTAMTTVKSEAATEPEESRLIQIALCLDTSGSMDGLIESAKQKLWAIVNDLATAEPTPKLEVALLTFGNDGHLAENGWVHVDAGLTTDLDMISEQLFALTTNGGQEYVARVLRRTGSLQWNESEQTLRIAVVAGNEAADQDPSFGYQDVCAQLAEENIVVNSIYCGPAEDPIALGWRHVATLAGGTFATIDQNDGLVVVETPFDLKLAKLSQDLNDTYIPIGSSGAAGAANQKRQDSNAASLGTAAQAARGCTKASKLYSCSWDLVDAVREGRVDLAKIEDSELPEEMRSLPKDARSKFVAKKEEDRSRIQKEIGELGKERDRFIKDEIERAGLDASLSFDNVLRTAIRGQAKARGFAFEEVEDEVATVTETSPRTPVVAPFAAPFAATAARPQTSCAPALPQVSNTPADWTAGFTAARFSAPNSIQSAASPGPLYQQARAAASFPPQAHLIRLDPQRNDVEVAAFDALIDGAAQLRAGNSADVRMVGGSPRVPDAVVLLTDPEDWDLLVRLLSAKATLPAQQDLDFWLRVGERSYLVSRGGC